MCTGTLVVLKRGVNGVGSSSPVQPTSISYLSNPHSGWTHVVYPDPTTDPYPYPTGGTMVEDRYNGVGRGRVERFYVLGEYYTPRRSPSLDLPSTPFFPYCSSPVPTLPSPLKITTNGLGLLT